MRYALALGAVLLLVVPATVSLGANTQTFTGKQTLSTGTGGGNTTGGMTHRPTGVMGLNASDCRLDGGEVITPGDARCGKMGAPYCRKKNGEAACLTEQ
jgi:hypothetical protein